MFVPENVSFLPQGGNPMHSVSDRLFVVFLALSAVLGLIALLSPSAFRFVATRGARWFDSRKIVEVLDKQFDVDRYVLPHCRMLGTLVLASVAVMGYVYLQH